MINERIEELAKKHGLIHIHMSTGEYNDTLKKFEALAELIVRECAQFVEDKFDFCGDEIIIAEEVRKHFGVEE